MFLLRIIEKKIGYSQVNAEFFFAKYINKILEHKFYYRLFILLHTYTKAIENKLYELTDYVLHEEVNAYINLSMWYNIK